MDNPGYYQSLPSLLSYNRGEAKAASFRSWKMRWGLGTGETGDQVAHGTRGRQGTQGTHGETGLEIFEKI